MWQRAAALGRMAPMRARSSSTFSTRPLCTAGLPVRRSLSSSVRSTSSIGKQSQGIQTRHICSYTSHTADDDETDFDASSALLMSDLNDVACRGCGHALQSSMEKQPGFIPPSVVLGMPENVTSAGKHTLDFSDELFDAVGLDFVDETGVSREVNHSSIFSAGSNNSTTPGEDMSRFVEVSGLPTRSAERRKRREARPTVCQRCFVLRHYGRVLPLHVPIESFRDRLAEEIAKQRKSRGTKVCIVQVVDLFDVDGSFFPNFGEFLDRASDGRLSDVPVIIVGNKYDLLPTQATEARVVAWLRREVEGRVQGAALHGVYVASSLTGYGVEHILDKVREALHRDPDHDYEKVAGSGKYANRGAAKHAAIEEATTAARDRNGVPSPDRSREQSNNTLSLRRDLEASTKLTPEAKRELREKERQQKYAVYIVGCSNSGKSTFVNTTLQYLNGERGKWSKFKRREKPNAESRAKAFARRARDDITVSPLPGTTLETISMPFGTGSRRPSKDKRTSLIDTPGVLQGHELANMLRPKELAMLLPGATHGHGSHDPSRPHPSRSATGRIKPRVHNMHPGRSLLLGGIVRIDYVSGPLGAYITTFVSPQLYHHLTRADKVDDLLEVHRGRMLTPPVRKRSTDDIDARVPLEEHEVRWSGTTWRKAEMDISLPGIGWFSVTGPGDFVFRVSTPRSCPPRLRADPLLPYETPARGRTSVVHKR